MEEAIDRMSKVFGIVNICPAVSCDKDMESIAKTTVECLNEMDTEGKTFKVEAKRSDKKFPYKSPDNIYFMRSSRVSRICSTPVLYVITRVETL